LQILALLALVTLMPVLWRGRRAVASTTLMAAWRYVSVAALFWAVVSVATLLWPKVDPAIADQLWYIVAVLMLCPLVSVLGARRPVTRVWNWFVIIPLVLVLTFPMVATWSHGVPSERLQLETPAVLGYTLVLVMGVGNYFGTRFTVASLLLAASLLMLVIPFWQSPSQAPSRDSLRVWATAVLGAAALTAIWQGRSSHPVGNSFDRLWIDFRDYFGIVWAKRIQDRINQTAHSENWPVRLEMHGLQPIDPAAQSSLVNDASRVERAFRWLFRRFAEPDWIDERLNSSNVRNDAEPRR
jgi:hypothetical protein